MPVSVLHVTQPLDGGAAVVVQHLCEDQARRGWDVTVAVPPGGPLDDALPALGVKVVPWRAGRRPGPATVWEVERLLRVVRASAPDLVHLHSAKAGLAGRLALRAGLPTVFQPHSWSFEAASGLVRRGAIAWERYGTRWADAVICVSEAERERAVALDIEAIWRVIPNGVDLERFPVAGPAEREEARRRLGLDGSPLAVCVARLHRQKGQDVLIDAWRAVEAAAPGASLALVGDGDQRPLLEGAAAGLSVLFTGLRSDVEDWLAAADVVVMPSRWEGMSLSMLEALARGRSTVITDVGGAREVVGDAGAGAIVPVDDRAALASAVSARLLDPGQAAEEGRRGRALVEQRYDLRVANARTASLYEELLGIRGTDVHPEPPVTRRAVPSAAVRVDVGIPTHGSAPYLVPAIESVLAQTTGDWKLTVSENGPGGGEIEELVQQYLRDPRVRYRATGTNIGPAGNWSSLLQTGEAAYVALLNDDDLWDPDFLARRVGFLGDHPGCGFVFSDQRLVNQAGRVIGATRIQLAEGEHVPEVIVPVLYRENVVGVPTPLMRRAAVEAVTPAFDPTYFMFDYEFWFRLAVRFPVGFLPVRDCSYRLHGGALSTRSRRDYDERQWLRLVDRLDELVDENGLGPTLGDGIRRRRHAYYELAAALDALEARRLRSSASLLAAGVRRDPLALLDPHVRAALVHRLRARGRGLRLPHRRSTGRAARSGRPTGAPVR